MKINHINIEQTVEEQINSSTIDALVSLAEDKLNGTDAELKGSIFVTQAKDTKVDKIKEAFPNLNVRYGDLILALAGDSLNEDIILSCAKQENWVESEADILLARDVANGHLIRVGGFRTSANGVNIKDARFLRYVGINNTNIYIFGQPYGGTQIKYGFFSGCLNLELVEIPDHITTLVGQIFRECRSLKSFDFKNVEYLYNSGSVYYNSNTNTLTTNNLGINGTYYAGDLPGMFLNNTSLTELKNFDKLKTISSYAFYGCSKLNLTELPPNLTAIGAAAFLKTLCDFISLPTSVTDIGTGGNSEAFWSSNQTHALYNRNWISFALLVTGIGREAYLDAYIEVTSEGKITLQNQGVGASAFSDNTYITEIEGISTYIGANAFKGCTNLTKVTCRNAILYDHAFLGCTSLTTITGAILPTSGSSTFGYEAEGTFKGCTSLTQIPWDVIPTIILGSTFLGCTSLTGDLIIPERVTKMSWTAFKNTNLSGTLSIPSTLTSFKDNSRESPIFSTVTVALDNTTYHSSGNCIVKTSDNTLQYIGSTATIPEGVTTLNNNYLRTDTPYLITLPSTLTTIKDNQNDLIFILNTTLPSGVLSITTPQTFLGWSFPNLIETGFSNITYINGVRIFAKTHFPLGLSLKFTGLVSMSGDGMFSESDLSGTLDLSNGALEDMSSTKGLSMLVFRCHNIQKVIIGDGGGSNARLGESCFRETPKLKVIDLPSSITYMMGTATNSSPQPAGPFQTKLNYLDENSIPQSFSIILRASTPPIGNGAIYHQADSTKARPIVYVPDASISAYASNLYWSQLYDNGLIKPLSEYVE